MSLWKFGDFEAEVDFTDADFLDAIEDAKAVMHEAEQNVPVVGKNSDIIRAQCSCFYAFFDTLFGDGAGERILCGKNSIKLCTDAAANEPGHLVSADVFLIATNRVSFTPTMEIEEVICRNRKIR